MIDMITMPVDLSVREKLLRKQVCFAQLTDEEIDVLAKLLVEKKFLAGETIVKEGDPVDSFYLLVSGTADVRKMSFENNTPTYQSIATLNAEKGDAIGLNESGFYSLSGLRTATVVAETDVLALFLTVPLFHGFSLAYSHVNAVMRDQSSNFVFKR
jgi:CRP-like cAMP-binding protein